MEIFLLQRATVTTMSQNLSPTRSQGVSKPIYCPFDRLFPIEITKELSQTEVGGFFNKTNVTVYIFVYFFVIYIIKKIL